MEKEREWFRIATTQIYLDITDDDLELAHITIKDMQADHVVPLHLGGEDDISNLYPACRACNHYKSTYTVERFREIIERAYDTQMKCSATFRNLVRFGMIARPRTDVRFWFERW